MSAEYWKAFFDWGTVVLLGLTFVFGAGALLTGKILSDRQDAQLREFDKSLTDAKTELGKQQERAAKAERALLEERQHAANRDISPEDQAIIAEKLRAFPGQRASIEIFPVTFETRFLAGQIEGILSNAKWNISSPPKLWAVAPILTVQGVGIQSTPDKQSMGAARELFRLLSPTAASGVLIPPGLPATSRKELPNPENPRVVVLVGDKPTPLRSGVK